jgi:hypothetical protein
MSELSNLYARAESLNEEIPSELAKKISIYAEIQQITGKMHASAVNAYGLAYSKRKLAYAQAIQDTEGTGIMKESAAEIAANSYRVEESKAEAEKERWRNAKDSNTEIINALKVQLKTLMNEYNDRVG